MQLPDSDNEAGIQRADCYVGRQNLLERTLGPMMDKLKSIEASINASTFGRVFRLDGSEHVSRFLQASKFTKLAPLTRFTYDSQPDEIKDASFFTEVRAGLTTFATMAYIIAVNVGPKQSGDLHNFSND